ncbi:spore gernimation protein [Photobacterium sp.]|uniref:spore gernimation protein n=1 Tax=Photobacterium sp. TaxID=660 RepID=UPI00299F2EF1|nr:spore gernimation protein [Photobacterium sp.]MDX1304526.1 spore gernimation protein [Photobacterium sp.]
MNKRLIGCTAFGAMLALGGCSEDVQVTVSPVNNVEKMNISDQTQIDVYCPTGICQFDISSNEAITVTVTMHYDNAKMFRKIEGVSVTGKAGPTAKVLSANSFSMGLSGDNESAKIQVVDYYR